MTLIGLQLMRRRGEDKGKWFLVLNGIDMDEVVEASSEHEAIEAAARACEAHSYTADIADYIREYARAYPLERLHVDKAIRKRDYCAFISGRMTDEEFKAELEPFRNAKWFCVDREPDMWAPFV